jgi:phage shock protein A
MSLEQQFHKVESDLYDLAKRLWDGDPAGRLEEVDRLSTELQEAYDALSRCRAAATETRRRIAANEVKAALLASQVETCLQTGDRDAAWQLALELDQVRQYLTADRAELPYLEKACGNQQKHIARVEHRLGEVQARLNPS